MEDPNNKTQCQLCKRLVGPIVPLYWSGVVWFSDSDTGLSGVKYVCTLVTTLLFCIFKVFLHLFGTVLRRFNAFCNLSCKFELF